MDHQNEECREAASKFLHMGSRSEGRKARRADFPSTSNEDSNRSLRDRKKKADEEDFEWTPHYLFHWPLKRVFRKKKKKKKKGINIEAINGVENEGGQEDDIMMNQGTQDAENDTFDNMIDSQDNLNRR